jgi:hypothetical protein
MDRVISLLAALVGLIALGGAILVHTNGDTQRQQMATEIAQLKASLALMGQPTPGTSIQAAAPAPAAKADDGVADALLALQDRIATLEQTTKTQASALQAAQAQISALPSQQPTQVAAIDPAALPSASGAPPSAAAGATPAAVVSDGPTTDCIPLGTRFMGAAGDSFPICKTKMVIKVVGVSDGLATIGGAGDVAQGGTGNLDKGCNVAVFSADLASGYAEMRVTCT